MTAPHANNYFPVGFPEDFDILTLWRAHKDTLAIAKVFWVHESYIASRLPSILERSRQDQEWNFDRPELRA